MTFTSNPDVQRKIAFYAAPTFIAATWNYTPPEMYLGLQNVSVSTRVPPVLVAACFAADHITVSMAIYPTALRARGSQSLSTWHSLPHCPGKFSNPRRESKVALRAALTWYRSWRHVAEPFNLPAYIDIFEIWIVAKLYASLQLDYDMLAVTPRGIRRKKNS